MVRNMLVGKRKNPSKTLRILKNPWLRWSVVDTFVDFSWVSMGFLEQAQSMALGGLQSCPKHAFGEAPKPVKNLANVETFMAAEVRF